jgi:KaiC/GvpD/RAD55 family RecA-like ATPase
VRGDHATQGIEEFLAAGVVVLKVNQTNDKLSRTLEIKKMRGTAVEPCEYPFGIVKGKGVVIMSSASAPASNGDAKKPIVVEDVSFQGLEYFELPKD